MKKKKMSPLQELAKLLRASSPKKGAVVIEETTVIEKKKPKGKANEIFSRL